MSNLILNKFSRDLLNEILKENPNWKNYLIDKQDGLLEICIPAPEKSKTDSLIILATEDNDIWIRFSMPHFFYSVDSVQELLSVVQKILANEVSFCVTYKGSKWTGTTLIDKGYAFQPEPGEIVSIVSWSGEDDS